jgi:hypothetical protein
MKNNEKLELELLQALQQESEKEHWFDALTFETQCEVMTIKRALDKEGKTLELSSFNDVLKGKMIKDWVNANKKYLIFDEWKNQN